MAPDNTTTVSNVKCILGNHFWVANECNLINFMKDEYDSDSNEESKWGEYGYINPNIGIGISCDNTNDTDKNGHMYHKYHDDFYGLRDMRLKFICGDMTNMHSSSRFII